jgi:putative transcriptional regulator
MIRLAAALLFLLAIEAGAQQDGPPNAILLIAKPSLLDPTFRQTVVLVTQAPDFSTVGVILNRPTDGKHEKSGEPVYFGGPVMPRTTVALFRTENVPGAAAFPLLRDVYLSMHPENIEPLLASPGKDYRLYAGFSGWAPRQLESEMEREGWYMLPVTEELIFRKNTDGMWRELLEKAQRGKTPHVRGLGAGYTFSNEARPPHPIRPGAAGERGGRPGAGRRPAAGGAPGVS